jgi:hypothetical protein
MIPLPGSWTICATKNFPDAADCKLEVTHKLHLQPDQPANTDANVIPAEIIVADVSLMKGGTATL